MLTLLRSDSGRSCSLNVRHLGSLLVVSVACSNDKSPSSVHAEIVGACVQVTPKYRIVQPFFNNNRVLRGGHEICFFTWLLPHQPAATIPPRRIRRMENVRKNRRFRRRGFFGFSSAVGSSLSLSAGALPAGGNGLWFPCSHGRSSSSGGVGARVFRGVAKQGTSSEGG